MATSDFDALYLRKSRDKRELADPDLLHTHRREMLRQAETRGYLIKPEMIYTEQGSGDMLRNRPECRRLLQAIDRLPRGNGGRLWTTEVSRLTRGSLSDRGRVFESLSRAHIVHVTRSQDFDLTDHNDLFQWELFTSISRHELGQFKSRADAARLEMALQGRLPTGKPPFGWIWDRNARNSSGGLGVVRADPLRFPVMQAICADALHLSCAALAEKYGLDSSRLLYMLRNPFLCGYPAKRHAPHGGARVRADNQEPWISSTERVPRERWIMADQPADYPAACTREHWEAIQVALDERRVRRAHCRAENGWCRDVVRFVGHPAHARLGSINKGPLRMPEPTYDLGVPRGVPESPILIARSLVHAAAEAVILPLFRRPDLLRAAMDGLEEAGRRRPVVSDVTVIAAEVARLERLVVALLEQELCAADEGDRQEADAARQLRAQSKAQLKAAQAALDALDAPNRHDPAMDDLRHLLAGVDAFTLAEAWDRIGDIERRIITRGVVQEIRCRVEPREGRFWTRQIEAVVLKCPFTVIG